MSKIRGCFFGPKLLSFFLGVRPHEALNRLSHPSSGPGTALSVVTLQQLAAAEVKRMVKSLDQVAEIQLAGTTNRWVRIKQKSQQRGPRARQAEHKNLFPLALRVCKYPV